MASIRKRNGRFQVQVRRRGHKGISKTFQRLQEAQTWARQMEVEMDKGELLPTLDPGLKLKDLIERYRDTVTPGKKAVETEKYKLGRLLRQPIAETPLRDLSPALFASYRDERVKDGVRACHYDLVLLQHMIRLARDEWGIPIKSCPIKKIKKPKLGKSCARRLEEGELERVLVEAERSRNPYLKPIIIFAVETAMRRGEILALEWEDISFSGKMATIRTSKNGESRIVPLTQTALRALEEINSGEGKVFPVTANALRLAWRRGLHRAEIKRLRFHDLRHEGISRLFENKLSVPEVALVSGHRDLKQLHKYTHLRVQAIGKKLSLDSG